MFATCLIGVRGVLFIRQVAGGDLLLVHDALERLVEVGMQAPSQPPGAIGSARQNGELLALQRHGDILLVGRRQAVEHDVLLAILQALQAGHQLTNTISL
jgi:hypothetical protein